MSRLPIPRTARELFFAAALACVLGAPVMTTAQSKADARQASGVIGVVAQAQRPAARRSRSQRADTARRQPAQPAPTVAPVEITDLPTRSGAELRELIAEQRKTVKVNPRDETARRNLGWISVETANRILQAESLGHAREILDLAALVRAELGDTLWRVTQYARAEPVRVLAALGVFHGDGILAPRDAGRGCDYFAKAAAFGHAGAAYRASGCIAKSDPERARRWLEQSANGGHAGAQEAMGRACIENTSVDAACAKKWLEPAAAQGRVSAMSVLAWLYAREGTETSLSRASNLYRAAAEADDLAAQNNLGEFYETGRGVPREPGTALEWYRKSAERGFGPAQFNLARLLAFGMGTARDSAAAREWATRAQEQGIGQAAELLKLLAGAEQGAEKK